MQKIPPEKNKRRICSALFWPDLVLSQEYDLSFCCRSLFRFLRCWSTCMFKFFCLFFIFGCLHIFSCFHKVFLVLDIPRKASGMPEKLLYVVGFVVFLAHGTLIASRMIASWPNFGVRCEKTHRDLHPSRAVPPYL